MVLLGIYMTVSGFVVTLFNYLFIAWMNARGGMADVGYYQAGYNLMNRYFGLIFTAMGMEFYPRLAAVCGMTSLRYQDMFRSRRRYLCLFWFRR